MNGAGGFQGDDGGGGGEDEARVERRREKKRSKKEKKKKVKDEDEEVARSAGGRAHEAFVDVEGSPVREVEVPPEVSEKKAAEVVKAEKAPNMKGSKKEVGFKLDDETL